jgi:hypothetical protein
MDQLKTILKFHFRSAKIAYKMLAVSAEVFCRHSFGQRYAPNLLASFFCSFVTLSLLRKVVPQEAPIFVSLYLFGFFILLLWHLVHMWRPRATIQSHSNGQSLNFLARLDVNPNIVRILLEPSIVLFIGALFIAVNQLLSVWIMLGAICLFIKETLAYFQFANRILDAIDARLEGERIGTGVRRQTTPQVGGEQAVIPVATVDPGQLPASPIQQIYSGLDPALQRLMATPNQNRPATRAPIRPANRPAVIRTQNRPVVKRPRINGAHRPKPPWEL